MLISYNWLKKFVKIEKSPGAVANKITLSLAEIESLEKKGQDHILEIENKGLTHRPDCFSHLGMAREVAAFFNLKLNDPLAKLAAKKFKPEKKLPLEIKIQAKDLCPRYCGIVLTDLQIGPSPNWLKTGLERLNIRSINNVVDITNFVMVELGQPLHAFDYDKVKDHQIIVRTAKKGETIITLDGVKRTLKEDSLLIADVQEPLAIASVMGGQKAEISPETKSIVIESANFEPKNSRITSKKLSLRTEASTRYEKNLDFTLTLPAINRAVELIQKTAGGKVASPLIDVQNKQFKPKTIKVSPQWLNGFIGLNLNDGEIISILERLAFKVKKQASQFSIEIPSWRQDVNLEADIAEEITRIYGYDKIPVSLPKEEARPPKTNPHLFWRKKIKLFLKGLGFTEVMTPPFVGTPLLESCGVANEEYLTLVNPLTVDQEFMRRSLVPSLLSITKTNLKYFNKFRIFEIDRVYLPQDKKKPQEIPYLTGLAVREKFIEIKGVVEALLEEMGVKNFSFQPYKLEKTFYGRVFHPGRTAEVMVKNESLGVVGEINPSVLHRLGIKKRIVAFDLDFEQLEKLSTTIKKYQPLFKYPAIVEDLSFVVPPQTLVGEIKEAVQKTSSLIRSVKYLDSYQDTRTFRITYQSDKKTLSDPEARKIRKKIVATVSRKFRAKIKTKA